MPLSFPSHVALREGLHGPHRPPAFGRPPTGTTPWPRRRLKGMPTIGLPQLKMPPRLMDSVPVEFAVAGLGVRDVVCGHYRCRATRTLPNPEAVAARPRLPGRAPSS